MPRSEKNKEVIATQIAGVGHNHRRRQQSVLAAPKLADEKKDPDGIPERKMRKRIVSPKKKGVDAISYRKETWDEYKIRVRKYLIKCMREIPGLLTTVDGSAIDAAADAVITRKKLELEIEKYDIPMIDRLTDKVTDAHKYLETMKKNEHKLISELGLNPMTRKSIHVEKGNMRQDVARRGEDLDDAYHDEMDIRLEQERKEKAALLAELEQLKSGMVSPDGGDTVRGSLVAA